VSDATPPGEAGNGRGGHGNGGDGDGNGGVGVGNGGDEGSRAPRTHPLSTNWRQPLLTVIGMSISVGLLALVDPKPGPLVLAAVLAMTISRNKLVVTWRGRGEAILLLPIVGLATAGVGYLFVFLPIVGAIAYVAAMFLAIFLRRFGPVWTRVGSLIALPFITLLIAPGAGVGTTPVEVALLSVGVLVVVVALRLLAEATHFLPRVPKAPGDTSAKPARDRPADENAAQESPALANRGRSNRASANMPRSNSARSSGAPQGVRPVASTRMAIQMAIALTAAFVLGALVFPQHVTWVVLTAFIVCSGNRGRADVLYKSGLRIVGAAIGTIVASVGLGWLTPAHPFLQGPVLVISLLAIIGIGLWLREWTYAAWAVVMTLVITLLQGVAIPVGALSTGEQLWIRILAIIVGAACGLAASWFVLPVRSEGVVRRRIADALAALSEYAGHQSPLTEHDLAASLDRLDEIAAPWNALERVTIWRKTLRKPGQWIGLVHECVTLVRARPQLSGAARRALGNARKSMRQPDEIGENLLVLRDELRAS
jgi:Fusaric acid resistance protein-like